MSLSKANSETALDSKTKTKANGSGANRNQPIVEKLLNRYIKLLVEKPVLTKGLTSCVVAGLGNFVSQLVSGNPNSKDGRIVWRSVLAYSTFGLVFSGPLIHHFYRLMEKLMPSSRKSKTDPIKRIILDRLIFAPPFIVLFLYVIAILEGQGNAAAIQKIRDQYWSILLLNWKVWTPVQYLNVNYIPPKYRVLFGNLIAFVWTIIVARQRRLASK
ncbi:hypothetical protein ScPMuIL_005454 [Solemya velum]